METGNETRAGWNALAAVAAVAALIIASIAVARTEGHGMGGSLSHVDRHLHHPIPGVASDTGTDAGAATSDTTTLEVVLSEFAIRPAQLEAPPGRVVLEIANDGAIVHNVVAPGLGERTPDFGAGGSSTLDLGELGPGTYTLICDIPGHESAGMAATLTVTEDAVVTPSAAGDPHGDVDWAALDRAMTESILAFPAETEGVGNQPLEPTVLADGTKEFELTARIAPWEVEPGRVVEAWTYNGQVPAPMIRAEVGDRLRFVVHNELPMSTDVHWHGVRVPNEVDGVAPVTQELIPPGGTFVYEFTAQEPAVGMYHPHHHAHHKVINGMLGAVIIGDLTLPRGRTIGGVPIPADLEVSQEFPMVLNDAGAIGYSLDGKSFPATRPVITEQGDWILVHYMNEGLQIHPMHLHGFPQLVVGRDGFPVDSPYWADTVNVAPGERWSVLVNTDLPGTWVWHCHVLTHVERDEGMFGMVTAVLVQ